MNKRNQAIAQAKEAYRFLMTRGLNNEFILSSEGEGDKEIFSFHWPRTIAKRLEVGYQVTFIEGKVAGVQYIN